MSADVSVRVAWSEDAAAIAGLQVDAWRERFPADLPLPSPEEVAAVWSATLARPTDARNRVLVALERNRVTGFALCGPAGDPDCDPIADGEVSEFTVAAADRGAGHGSRLLQAAVDTLVADRFTRAVTWCTSTDDALRGFLTAAGWATDGAHRSLASEDGADGADHDGAEHLKQVRLHTAIA